MGYETTMYVGVPYKDGLDSVIQVEQDDYAHNVFNDKDKKGQFFYLSDGNTKRYVSSLKRLHVGFEIFQAKTMMVVFMVDLCKASYGAMGEVIASGHKKDGVYGCFYASDGNSLIAMDRYGEHMSFVPAKDVLVAMKMDNSAEEYRRFTIAIGALKAAIKTFPGEQLQVLFFGH